MPIGHTITPHKAAVSPPSRPLARVAPTKPAAEGVPSVDGRGALRRPMGLTEALRSIMNSPVGSLPDAWPPRCTVHTPASIAAHVAWKERAAAWRDAVVAANTARQVKEPQAVPASTNGVQPTPRRGTVGPVAGATSVRATDCPVPAPRTRRASTAPMQARRQERSRPIVTLAHLARPSSPTRDGIVSGALAARIAQFEQKH